MKNIVKTFLVLLIAVLTLASCSLFGSNQNSGGESGSESGGWVLGDNVYYCGDADVPIESLKDNFLKKTKVSFLESGAGESSKLFIVGEYVHELSAFAYSKMERDFSEAQGNTIFTICTDGNSVAIAYDSMVARYAALDYFFDEFYNLDLSKAGVVASKEFNVSTYVAAQRNEMREEQFSLLVEVLSDGAVTQMENLYTFYGEELYIWLANLYDPDNGGFYYSASGRDTEGFLPDLESTAQALMFMSESGMLSAYGNKYRLALPEEMKAAILAFAKNAQDSEDGYFYHKQWGKSISSTRLGRDLGWATRIISGLGGTPYWDTPNGVSGERGAPGVKATALTASFANSLARAVSKVIPVATPEYLSDLTLFKKHLEEDYDLENASYRAGNAIESELGQIQNAGDEFTDALIEFLNSRQKPNGLWEKNVNYDSVNGLMKISGVYTSLKKVIPNADAAMQSAIQILKSEETPAHVCSVYNPWEAVANILISIESVSGESEADELRAQFRNEAEALIKITREKLALFKKDDGAFSYYIKYSAPNSQGSAVALDKSAEGDVNASMICTNSIIRAMFDVFGLEEVSRYSAADYAYIYDTFCELGTIIKDELLPAKTITFDEYDKVLGEEECGVVKYPDDYAENVIGDTEFLDGDRYKWFESSIVEDPSPDAKRGDLVLYSKSNVYVGENKALADKPSSTRFKIANASLDTLGDCYVYDADMYFVGGYGKTNSSGVATSDPIMQIFFMTDKLPCASLNFSVYTEHGTDYVKIGENYAGLDGKEANLAGGIPMGEWVNIRLEFYKRYEPAEDGGEVYKPVMKIFVNEKYHAMCDATITGANSSGGLEYYDRDIDQISISYYRYLASEVYFDNVLVERCKIEYQEGENPNEMVDPPLPDEDMRESYGFEDGVINTSNVANKVRVVDFGVPKYINATEGQTYNPSISYSITADPDPEYAANHVLKVVTLKSDEFDKPSRTEVNLYNSSADGTDYVFSARFYYSSADIGKNGDLTQLFIMNSTEGLIYSVRINTKQTNGKFKLSLIENNKSSGTGSDKTIVDNIDCDKWFSLKIVFHATRDASTCGADIYLDGEHVMTDMSYKSAALLQTPIVKFAIVHQKTNKSVLYLDDLSFAKSGEVRDTQESEERVASFTDGFNTKYLHSYTYDGNEEISIDTIDTVAMESYYTKYYLYEDPTDKTNLVLRAVNKNGGINAGYTRVDISNEKPQGNCYTLEMRLRAETYKAGFNFACIKFMDKNSAAALSLYISIDSATSKIKVATTGSGVYPAAGTNLLDGSGVAIGGKTWLTLRMEFYHEGDSSTRTNTYLKVFVNDILTYSGAAYANLGAEIDYVKLEHCKTTQSSAVYYDDISLTRIDKEYKK